MYVVWMIWKLEKIARRTASVDIVSKPSDFIHERETSRTFFQFINSLNVCMQMPCYIYCCQICIIACLLFILYILFFKFFLLLIIRRRKSIRLHMQYLAKKGKYGSMFYCKNVFFWQRGYITGLQYGPGLFRWSRNTENNWE